MVSPSSEEGVSHDPTVTRAVRSPLGRRAAAAALTVVPNPVSSSSEIEFVSPHPVEDLRIDMFDVRGRRVARVWSGKVPAGLTRIPLGRRSGKVEVASGIYWLKAAGTGLSVTTKVAVVR